MHLVAQQAAKANTGSKHYPLACPVTQYRELPALMDAWQSPEEPLDSAGKVILVVGPGGKGERGSLWRTVPTSFKN